MWRRQHKHRLKHLHSEYNKHICHTPCSSHPRQLAGWNSTLACGSIVQMEHSLYSLTRFTRRHRKSRLVQCLNMPLGKVSLLPRHCTLCTWLYPLLLLLPLLLLYGLTTLWTSFSGTLQGIRLVYLLRLVIKHFFIRFFRILCAFL